MKYFRVIIFLFLASCSKELTIELPPMEGKLVLNCFFSTGENFLAYIGKSSRILDSDTNAVSDALVSLYADNIYQGNMAYTENSFYIHDTVLIRPNILYRIAVSVIGFDDVEAEDMAPEPTTINEVYYDPEQYLDSEGDDFYKLSVGINDSPIIDNYYELVLQRYKNEEVYDLVSIRGDNEKVIIGEGDSEFYSGLCLFSDALIDSEPYELDLQTGISLEGNKKVLNVLTVSKEYYLFRKSLIRHLNGQFPDLLNPTEPVNLYSNVKGGYGIFAGYSKEIVITDSK